MAIYQAPAATLAVVRPPRAIASAWQRLVSACFVKNVLAPFLVTRAVLAAVGLVTVAFVPRIGGTPSQWLTDQRWLSIWAIWDSRWYLSIARDGYSYLVGQETNAAFAPGLPLLMRGAGGLLGQSDDGYLIAGFVITNVALLVALVYLLCLVRLDFDANTAGRAVLYLLVFPTSFFLSAVYPHSLFLAFAIASIYYARTDRWWLAGLLGCAAGLTRLQASAIVLPLAYEYLRQRRFNVRALDRRVLALGLVPVGSAAFGAYLWAQTGDPLAALHAGAVWHRQLTWPWEVLAPFLADPLSNHGWRGTSSEFVVTCLLLLAAGLSWRWLPKGLALFATTFALIVVSSGTLSSSIRYALEAFPIFIALATLGRNRLFHRAYLALACLNALRLMSRFALGDWIA